MKSTLTPNTNYQGIVTVKQRSVCFFFSMHDTNIPRGVLGTRVNSDPDKIQMIQIRARCLWTSKLDLNTDTCGRGNL